MKNITLALDEDTLAAGRAYAERHQTTLNALVRDLLARTVHTDRKATAAETANELSGGHAMTLENLGKVCATDRRLTIVG